jgi:hypothetical protein
MVLLEAKEITMAVLAVVVLEMLVQLTLLQEVVMAVMALQA